jgi:hypothetical protein
MLPRLHCIALQKCTVLMGMFLVPGCGMLGGGTLNVGETIRDGHCEVVLLSAHQLDYKGMEKGLFGGKSEVHKQAAAYNFKIYNTGDIEQNCRVGIELLHNGKVIADDDNWQGKIKPKSAGGVRCKKVDVLERGTTPRLKVRATLQAETQGYVNSTTRHFDSATQKNLNPEMFNGNFKEFSQMVARTRDQLCK